MKAVLLLLLCIKLLQRYMVWCNYCFSSCLWCFLHIPAMTDDQHQLLEQVFDGMYNKKLVLYISLTNTRREGEFKQLRWEKMVRRSGYL